VFVVIILKSDHSNERCFAVLSCGTFFVCLFYFCLDAVSTFDSKSVTTTLDREPN